jgi:putative oxygen-independent coproporphyrinogen III oxidase
MLNFQKTVPLSLYIHLPWCVKKCPYCDFNSHEIGRNPVREREYIDALIRDLEFELPRIWGRRVLSIFIGGGTPSLFSPEALEHLLTALRARLYISPGIEITLEANPGTAESKRFKGYRELGVNRLSIGIQSFNDDHLKRLGRIHDSGEARAAIDMAHAARFEDINLDLMFGLPQQTIGEALADLQTAIDSKPHHISWYQLTIEPNTVFYSRPPELPADDSLWEMQQQGQQCLGDNGFRQYEISAYAEEQHRCIHNLNYWQFGDYLGLGAGAHGKITDVAAGGVTRYARHRIPESYIQKAGTEQAITETRRLGREDLALEFMMNALRLTDGIPPSLFLDRTGLPLNCIRPELERAESKGLIKWDIRQLKATATGQRYLNDLLQLFMPETVNSD